MYTRLLFVFIIFALYNVSWINAEISRKPTNCSAILGLLYPKGDKLKSDREFFCSPHHGLCYIHFFRNATHWEAKELCRSVGGHIARMYSDEESLFLTAKVKANFHLPGIKTIRGDDYIFPRNMPTYARWVCRRENIPGECIGSVTRRALWKPIDCNTELTVLCGFD